jgi:signal transduction histidine kinase
MLRRAEVGSGISNWAAVQAQDGVRGSGISRNSVELRDLAANLMEAQEEECRRVACELHDELGQSLALLEIQIEEMKRRLGSDEKIAAELGALRTRVGNISDDVHRICYRLHPAILENLGLIAGLRSYCEEYSTWSGIKTRFSHCDVPTPLPSGTALCVYRVVQESLCNVAKHSRSARAIVMLRGARQGVEVVIKDSGRGFLLDEARAKGGLGLISLSERVRLAGGTCAIVSAPDHGTRIQAWIPLGLEACAG